MMRSLGAVALLLALPIGADAQSYRLVEAVFHPELCADLRIPVLMDWPRGKTDTTNNGEGRDPSMVMDRAVQYHWKGAPVSLIQWQDPEWVPELKQFRMGWEITGEGNILMGARRVDNANVVMGQLRAIPSMDLSNVSGVLLVEPKGPLPAYPATFDFRIGAGDGGVCPWRPFADYFFVLEDE